VRALASKRGRVKRGRFLVEGPKGIAEVLSASPELLEWILFRPDASNQVDALCARADRAGVPAYAVEPELFAELSSTETPQPVIAVAFRREAELAALLPAAPAPAALVACVGVQDPGNLGTIVRSARFLGFSGLVACPGTVDPWSPKVVRSAAGALLACPPACLDLDALLELADEQALTPVALVARGGQAPRALPKRSLILLGSEGQGLPPEAEAALKVRVTIPARDPRAESLNVASAFGIVAHAWAAEHLPT